MITQFATDETSVFQQFRLTVTPGTLRSVELYPTYKEDL